MRKFFHYLKLGYTNNSKFQSKIFISKDSSRYYYYFVSYLTVFNTCFEKFISYSMIFNIPSLYIQKDIIKKTWKLDLEVVSCCRTVHFRPWRLVQTNAPLSKKCLPCSIVSKSLDLKTLHTRLIGLSILWETHVLQIQCPAKWIGKFLDEQLLYQQTFNYSTLARHLWRFLAHVHLKWNN